LFVSGSLILSITHCLSLFPKCFLD
jgi:hypothetical protein